jgi:DDE superfamily endonuclease
MFTPPAEVSAALAAFASLFSRPSWARAQALLCGTLLAPANQTVTAALRALGLASEPGFQNYHRLLNRAHWSARQAACLLLSLLVEAFVPAGPIILWGSTIRSNAAVAGSSPPGPSITTRHAPAEPVFRRPAVCGG